MKTKLNIYRKLFTSTFYLSAFTFGGGFVIVPLMQKKFVQDLKWLEEEEMLNLTAIAQSSPGPIAVNASILIGYELAGITGAMVTILGTILPPFLILSVISLFYQAFRDNAIINAVLKGMQAGISAVIIDVVLTMGGDIVKEKKPISIITMLGAFIATYFFKINVIAIILVCGFIGSIYTICTNKRKEGLK